MKRFIEGQNREQASLFPERLDDYIDDDNPVRVVDAFIDALDLGKLGFVRIVPEATGRPGYHPSTLLKIYIYGYLNQVQSSRRLERECQRNVELVWLTGRLMPDFKTIADFRKDYGEAIQEVCRQFVELCRHLSLLSHASVAIDGSKFKAVNGRDKNFTVGKMKRRRGEVDKSIARYLTQLNSADRQESAGGVPVPAAKVNRLKEKVEVLHREIENLNVIEAEMLANEDRQISLTDPDARSMATSGRDTGVVGYNVQAAVDTEHHLIVTHEVTNVGTDRSQLSRMGKQAKTVLGADKLEAIADRGYYNGEEIVACENDGVTVLIPRVLTSTARAQGRFAKPDFVYLPDENVYICPTGERLTHHFTNVEKGNKTTYHYWTNACTRCPIKDQCTTGNERRIRRWEHENVLEDVQRRFDEKPDAMQVRRETVEHPFGTIKSWMGSTHFQMRRLKNVATEMALHVLAYNMKRVMNILGVAGLVQKIKT